MGASPRGAVTTQKSVKLVKTNCLITITHVTPSSVVCTITIVAVVVVVADLKIINYYSKTIY